MCVYEVIDICGIYMTFEGHNYCWHIYGYGMYGCDIYGYCSLLFFYLYVQ